MQEISDENKPLTSFGSYILKPFRKALCNQNVNEQLINKYHKFLLTPSN